MSDAPNDALVEPPVRRPVRLLNAGSWLRDLPYGVVLVLTLVGVAYTSFSKHQALHWLAFVVAMAIQRLLCFHSTKTPCLLQRGRLHPAA